MIFNVLPGSAWIRIHFQSWIQIRIKSMRIRNTSHYSCIHTKVWWFEDEDFAKIWYVNFGFPRCHWRQTLPVPVRPKFLLSNPHFFAIVHRSVSSLKNLVTESSTGTADTGTIYKYFYFYFRMASGMKSRGRSPVPPRFVLIIILLLKWH
jgi:hypothetical protein